MKNLIKFITTVGILITGWGFARLCTWVGYIMEPKIEGAALAGILGFLGLIAIGFALFLIVGMVVLFIQCAVIPIYKKIDKQCDKMEKWYKGRI